MSRNRRIFTTVLTMILVAISLSAIVGAKEFDDMKNHWSKTFVEYGVKKGYINGYENNTFRPDNTVTRAEFSKMINTAVGINTQAEIKFDDVNKNDWFYNEVLKAVYAGYVGGYEDGTFRPNNTITRQEAALILFRITLPTNDRENLSVFADDHEISDWAKDAVSAMVAKGYMSGDQFKCITPKGGLTRGAAAKLVYQFLENENIYSDTAKVDKNSSKFSETLIVGDVVVEENNTDLVLDSCRILGNLIVNASDTTCTLNGTVVSSIINNAKNGSNISADENCEIENGVVMNEQGSLSGNVYGKVTLSGEELSSGVVSLSGNFESVVADVSAIVRVDEGVIKNLYITDGINIILQKGEIENLTVENKAQGAVITLSSGATVAKATVNAQSTFMGTGIIKEAYNAVAGVKYETIPEILTGKGASDSNGNTVGKMETPVVYPALGASDVSRNSSITLSFDNVVYDKNGDNLTADYIENYIKIRKGTSGYYINYDALVNSNRRIIIDPKENLEAGVRYYIYVTQGAFKNSDGNVNDAYESYFTTSSESVNTTGNVTISPSNGATQTPVDGKITITFSQAMYRPNKSSLTEAYIKSSAIELRSGSSNGAIVDYSATIGSNRVITITPTKNLEPATRYYITIIAGSMVTSAGDAVTRTTSYFTTENTLLPIVTPKNNATGIDSGTNITIEFDSPVTNMSGASVTSSYIMGNVVELRLNNVNGQVVDFTARISADKKTITITPDAPLSKSTRYCVVVNDSTLKNSKGAVNEKVTSFFTTAALMAPIVTPANTEGGVPTDTKITVSFGETLYTTNYATTRKLVTADYVKNNNIVVLRKGSTNGTVVDCNVEVSSAGTITLIPKATLLEDIKYYVVVSSGKLYNSTGRYNSASSTYFVTSKVLNPEFSPINGETGVSVESNLQIYFGEAVYQANGSALTTTYVANNVVELHKGDENGELVDFAVTLGSDRRTITLNPYENLEGNTTYTVVIVSGSLVNGDDVQNTKVVSTFTTELSADTEIEFTPKANETGVSTSTDISVKFASKIYRYGGGAVTQTYAEENILVTSGSSNGKSIDAELIISDDGKTFTFIPKQALAKNTYYYIRINQNKFQYADDTVVPYKNVYFRTGTGVPVLSTFACESVGATSAVFTAKSDTDGILYITAKPTSGVSIVTNVAVAAGVQKEVTLPGLSPNSDYTVTAYVKANTTQGTVTKPIVVSTTGAIDAKVTEVTESTAVLKISAFADGKLTITYKNLATGEEKILFKNMRLTAGEENLETISGLAPGTEYQFTSSFTCDGTGEVPISITRSAVTKVVTDHLAISRIIVSDQNDNPYEAEIDGDKASAYPRSTSFVKVNVSVPSGTVVTVNGRSVATGSYSEPIAVVSGEDKVIPIEVKYNGQSKTYQLTVTVS